MPSPARAYVDGELESFRHLLTNLVIDGVPLANLTIRLEGSGLSIDYCKGPQWTETTINAFLELLACIHERAPGVRISYAVDGRAHRADTRFAIAFSQYETARP